MKKLFMLGLLMMPMAGFALETSDCETIGYWQSTVTTCEMYDDCVAWHKDLGRDDYEAGCSDRPHTAEECADKIAQARNELAQKAVLIKCPLSRERGVHKKAEQTGGVDGKLVSNDGADINVDDLIGDAKFVYYLSMDMMENGIYKWYAVVPHVGGSWEQK